LGGGEFAQFFMAMQMFFDHSPFSTPAVMSYVSVPQLMGLFLSWFH